MISLILLSAGEGKRFGEKKQFRKFLGKPLFMHSLEKTLGKFDEIILVLPPEDMERWPLPQGVKKVQGTKLWNTIIKSTHNTTLQSTRAMLQESI